jgi:hypothetical protein
LHENVDLNVYGKVINVMCDTFPFIGGYACREIAAQGTPVISMLGTRWDDLLREERSPELLANDELDMSNWSDVFIAIVHFTIARNELFLKTLSGKLIQLE